jgi:hypothetical protein
VGGCGQPVRSGPDDHDRRHPGHSHVSPSSMTISQPPPDPAPMLLRSRPECQQINEIHARTLQKAINSGHPAGIMDGRTAARGQAAAGRQCGGLPWTLALIDALPY